MESKNLLTLAITLTVGIILAGSLLMPVISDATETEKTFVNEGVFNYGLFTPDDEYTIEFTQATGTLIVNDEEVTPIPGVSVTEGKNYSVVASDNFLLRFGSGAGAFFLQIIGTDADDNSIAIVLNTGTCTGTINDGNFEVTYGTTTKTFEFTEIYGIVKDPSVAIMKAAANEVYIKGDSEIYASGVTNVSAWNNLFHFEGTYKDGITISSPNLPDATYDNIEWNIEAVPGYVDLYKLTSIEFDITYDETTVHATYSYFGVPSSVTAELSQHLDSGSIAILKALPVLIIVALVVMAAGALYLKRDD